MPKLTKILLVDSNPQYLTNVLPIYGYDVCCIFDGLQVLEILKNGEIFDIVIVDSNLQKLSDIELVKNIRKIPQVNGIPVIILSENNNEQKVANILNSGADDYIIKPVAIPVLLARIEAVLRRTKRVTDEDYKQNVTIGQVNQFNTLTKREKDVLLLVKKGESNKSVADKLDISEITVKSHLNNIFKKLNVTNRTQAVLFAMQMNLVENK